MTARTQDEILARYRAANDFLGFAGEVLVESMTADTIRQINPDAVLPADWMPNTVQELEVAAREYLEFAVGKIAAHRGLSAERSVIKLREFAWLLGRDDVVAAMDAAGYPQYGAPKVQAFAAGMGWSFGGDYEPELSRMARGWPCVADCCEGCDQ